MHEGVPVLDGVRERRERLEGGRGCCEVQALDICKAVVAVVASQQVQVGRQGSKHKARPGRVQLVRGQGPAPCCEVVDLNIADVIFGPSAAAEYKELVTFFIHVSHGTSDRDQTLLR